jgi:hypothetical protein
MLGGERHDVQSEGMIPRAVKQIFNTAREGGEMKCVIFPPNTVAHCWGAFAHVRCRYTLKAAFVEIYNESVRDLLGKVQFVAAFEFCFIICLIRVVSPRTRRLHSTSSTSAAHSACTWLT